MIPGDAAAAAALLALPLLKQTSIRSARKERVDEGRARVRVSASGIKRAMEEHSRVSGSAVR